MNNLIKELNKNLSLNFDKIKGVYFYGSRVKNCHNKDSDYDVVVVLNTEMNFEELLELAGVIGEIEYKYDVFIDYHPMTIEELEKNPYYYEEVVYKGKYYEAA